MRRLPLQQVALDDHAAPRNSRDRSDTDDFQCASESQQAAEVGNSFAVLCTTGIYCPGRISSIKGMAGRGSRRQGDGKHAGLLTAGQTAVQAAV